MKVLLVNTYDRGGAAQSCKRLHLGLQNAGVDSNILLKEKQNNWTKSYQFKQIESSISSRKEFQNRTKGFTRLFNFNKRKKKIDEKQRFLNLRPDGLEFFSFPDSQLDITQSPLYKAADIINLHWVANFLDYEIFFKKNTKPVIWTLHDMNPFSGGEHFEEKFLGIDEQGEPLIRKLSLKEIVVSNRILKLKKKIFAQVDNLNIVSPSSWLKKEAEQSQVFQKFKVKHIPYGLDPEIFKPYDKTYARQLLNIPEDKKVLLFVADSLGNNRKGFVYLKEAFKRLETKNLILCAIGDSALEISSENIIELGKINDERLMSTAYSAADVFILPSLMDNLPNTVLESLMCGTPVICFPVGGVPDMIKNGENGLITEEISVSSLHQTILKFLKSPENFCREKIREEAIKRYDYKIQAKRYISLFEDILYK